MLVTVKVYNDGEFLCARGVEEDVFTQATTIDELYVDIREAVSLHLEYRAAASEIDIVVVSELRKKG